MAQAEEVSLARFSTAPKDDLTLLEVFADVLDEEDDSMQCTVCAL